MLSSERKWLKARKSRPQLATLFIKFHSRSKHFLWVKYELWFPWDLRSICWSFSLRTSSNSRTSIKRQKLKTQILKLFTQFSFDSIHFHDGKYWSISMDELKQASEYSVSIKVKRICCELHVKYLKRRQVTSWREKIKINYFLSSNEKGWNVFWWIFPASWASQVIECERQSEPGLSSVYWFFPHGWSESFLSATKRE